MNYQLLHICRKLNFYHAIHVEWRRGLATYLCSNEIHVFSSYIDPRGRPTVVTVFAHIVRQSPLFKTKQISIENNVCYWRDCRSGRVDHS